MNTLDKIISRNTPFDVCLLTYSSIGLIVGSFFLLIESLKYNPDIDLMVFLIIFYAAILTIGMVRIINKK